MVQGFGPIAGELDVMALKPQRPAVSVPERLIVIDHDYPYWHGVVPPSIHDLPGSD